MILVTGGTKGIGKAILEKFMQNGHDAITCSRNNEELFALKEELEKKYSTKENPVVLYYRQADLSKKEDIVAFGDYAKKIILLNEKEAKKEDATKKPFEVMVNNTGVFIPGKILEEEEGSFETQIHTNLFSAYHLTRMLVPVLVERKDGHLFNICSTASITAYPNGGSYCISKFALHGMTKVLREELKEHNVKVTSVLPGATYTASWEGVELPQERFMPSSDIADTIYSVYSLSNQTVVEEIVMRPQLGDIV
ncbi:SDR family oxidoreductase [Bernardetia sp.]|uniref:SDR family oxidoreductase n=1 Tax=Bernardetia sp. TaxID=1937974 RepID=UPI0025B826FE|nr:SDR family oxidoreductase [Bernardetia sp.]